MDIKRYSGTLLASIMLMFSSFSFCNEKSPIQQQTENSININSKDEYKVINSFLDSLRRIDYNDISLEDAKGSLELLDAAKIVFDIFIRDAKQEVVSKYDFELLERANVIVSEVINHIHLLSDKRKYLLDFQNGNFEDWEEEEELELINHATFTKGWE